MTLIRSGCAGNVSGPTFFLPPDKTRKPEFSDRFLEKHGVARFSTIIMIPNGYLNDDVWVEIVPLLIKGIRYVVTTVAEKFGIDKDTAVKLLVGLLFDGCIIHLKNLAELI